MQGRQVAHDGFVASFPETVALLVINRAGETTVLSTHVPYRLGYSRGRAVE